MFFQLEFSMAIFHFFLISSAATRSLLSLSFIVAHLWVKCSLGISNFPKEISSLSTSVVFLYIFALFIEEGLLVSPCCSETLWLVGCTFPFLSCFFSSLLSAAICGASSSKHFAFLLFFWDGFVCCLLYGVTDLCPYFFRHTVY